MVACRAFRNSTICGLSDRAGEEPEVEAPEGNPSDHRELLPAEAVLQDRGVAPGDQVRARQGRSERPDSSTKTITRPCRAAIFLVRPPLGLPGANRPLVAFARLARRALHAPAELAQQPPHRGLRQAHREALLDQLCRSAATSTARSEIPRPAPRPSVLAPAPRIAHRTVFVADRNARPSQRLDTALLANLLPA